MRNRVRASWSNDLAAVHERRLNFDAFARRHVGVIRSFAKPWMSRCPSSVGLEDLQQEVLLTIWKNILEWNPERGVPIAPFIRRCVMFRLLRYTHDLQKWITKEARFLSQQVVEERVISIAAGNQASEAKWIAITKPDWDESYDVKRLVRSMLGELPSQQGHVIAGLLVGDDVDTATERAYGTRCTRRRKAALRAIAAAAQVVKSSQAPDDHKEEKVYGTSDTTQPQEAEQPRLRLKSIAKVQPHLGEGNQGLGAG